MRPLRLTMTAFGPYAGTESVDFDSLTELGLFVVAGSNGSGKTTIFDALHYSLFGTLPGRRATYIRLRSDHAPEGIECSVALDFVAKGKTWRVERSPKQRRPKRRGTGIIEVDSRATLFQLNDGEPRAVTNKIGEVTQQCRELVGLSGPQFERVALLPQGEFSRVLSQGTTERRELLRALFSSEIFSDATAVLTEAAAAASTADQSKLDQFEARATQLRADATSLTGVELEGRADEADVLDELAKFRVDQVSTLEADADELRSRADAAALAHHDARNLAERLARRDLVRQQLAEHTAAADQHDNDVARLALARAAIPVANQARAHAHQQSRFQQAQQNVAVLTNRVNTILVGVGTEALSPVTVESIESATDQLTRLMSKLAARRELSLRISDLTAARNRLLGSQRKLRNEATLLTEQMTVATTQRRQADSELSQLDNTADLATCQTTLDQCQTRLDQRAQLEQLAHQAEHASTRFAACLADVERLESEHDAASTARATHAKLELQAQRALTTLDTTQSRLKDAQRFAAGSQRLAQLRIAERAARQHADRLFDGFLAGTAARVAESLVDEEPCPVCGSAEHPEPATAHPGAPIVDQTEMAAARASAEDAQSECRLVERELEVLRETHADIATASTSELQADVAAAKDNALRAQGAADHAHQGSMRFDQVAAALVAARNDEAELRDEQRRVTQRRDELRGALGPLADVTIADVEQAAAEAAQAVIVAQRAVEQSDRLASQIADIDQTIETLGLEQLAVEGRRRSLDGEVAQRQHDCDELTRELSNLDATLSEVSATLASGPIGDLSEVHHQQCRRGLDQLAELTTALALLVEADDSARRAGLLLDEKLSPSQFTSVDDAVDAFIEPDVVAHLEAQIASYVTTHDRLRGQLRELAGLPDVAPDVSGLETAAANLHGQAEDTKRLFITAVNHTEALEHSARELAQARAEYVAGDVEVRRLERVAALVKGDNDRNTSLENWVLAAHLRDVVELANVRLARSTQQRFQLCVLDDGENRRGKWGLDLGVEDTVTGTRRPTAGLSGGELFQASLALALGLADAVMNQTSGVHIDALFIDEGFGSLDENSVERAIDLLDELRDRGALVGVITHVPALLEALPRGITVESEPDGQGSTIRQAA